MDSRVEQQHRFFEDQETVHACVVHVLKRSLEGVGPVDLEMRQRQIQRLAGHFSEAEHRCVRRASTMNENSDSAQARRDLLQQLKTLDVEIGDENRRAGDVPARSREAVGEPSHHSVAPYRHDDGDRRARSPGGKGAGRRVCHHDANLQTNQLRREVGQPIVISFGPAKLDDEVSSFDVTELAESRAKRRYPI
jgi:hypothetical protein